MSDLVYAQVTYTDDSENVQTDGYVCLADYPYMHVEGSGDSWVIKLTTVSAPTTQTATVSSTYATRTDAVTALNALVFGAGKPALPSEI